MTADGEFEIFLVATPGVEALLCAEARKSGFPSAKAVKGGVTLHGGWPDVWRANLHLRGASRILARIGSFRALHLAQLDKRARRIPWSQLLRPGVPFRVEAACAASRIYHSGAAAQRVERAILAAVDAPVSADAEVVIKARIEDDLCTIGVDTSGEPLHKRGHKEAVNKAPLRETLAALFLARCGYDGTGPVVDPMCGSGTFVIEAAEIAAGLAPGRSRRFAFEQLATFDAQAWQHKRDAAAQTLDDRAVQCFGSDLDAGAVAMCRANAERAGIGAMTRFSQLEISELVPPPGPPGLVIANPPYGARIGDKQSLHTLYRSLGETLRARFRGWRVGLVTSEPALAAATGLPFETPFGPVLHGGLRVHLYTTRPLP